MEKIQAIINLDSIYSKASNFCKVTALHGEYKEKLQIHDSTDANETMVLSPPLMKKEKVEQRLLKNLKEDLDSSNLIVLFGIGLESDPHITEMLNDIFDKNICVIHNDPLNFIVDRLANVDKSGYTKYKFLENNQLKLVTTNKNSCRKISNIPIAYMEQLNELGAILKDYL